MPNPFHSHELIPLSSGDTCLLRASVHLSRCTSSRTPEAAPTVDQERLQRFAFCLRLDTASVCPVISPLTPDKENGGVTHSHSCPPCSLIEARPVGLRKAPRTGCGLWGATELLATSVAARRPLDSKSIAWSLFKLEAQRRRRRFQHRFPPSVLVELQQVYVTGAPLLS